MRKMTMRKMMKTLIGPTLVLSCLATASAGATEAPGVSGGGVTLKSASIALPSDPRQFAGGASADAMNANCLTCHSAGMVLNQPHLAKAEWEAEVGKMRKAYGAPIAEADVPAIVAYLTALPAN